MDMDTFIAQTKVFDKVNQLLVDGPALALFDPSLQTVISTDASDYGFCTGLCTSSA